MVAAPHSDRRLAAVFLDAGGTLLSERRPRAALYLESALARGLECDLARMGALMASAHAALPREIGPHFRYSEGWFRHFIERVFVDGLGLPSERLDDTCAELFARFADPGTFAARPGAHELLDGLAARGLVVGVVSNWSERLPGILAGLGLDARLDFTVVSALERTEKPERAIFELALARAGVAASQALHCGDDPIRDVQGARALGILVVRVGDAPAPGEACVADLFELSRWINGRIDRT